MTRRYAVSLFALVSVGFLIGRAIAQAPPPPAPANCKVFGAGKCCDPPVVAHLSKEAVFTACGESTATFLGEQGSKDTCKYFFKVAGAKDDETYVQVYSPTVKDVPTEPTDPFFKWGMIGRVYVTEKALSPKAAPLLAGATGLWLPGKGFFVAVNASTKVCTKAEAKRLAPRMK
jgi:hypothetical protein